MAYDAYLINPYYNEQDSTLAGYYSIFGEGEPVAQVKDISESGYQGEYTLSVGTNFKDKLYLGMSIGIQTLNYKKSSVYTEAPPEQSLSEVDFYTFEEYYKMDGVGTNLKFGIIYRPIPQVRIGASIHTPTWYSFDYSWSTRSNTATIFMLNKLEISGSTTPTVRLFLDFSPRAYSFTW